MYQFINGTDQDWAQLKRRAQHNCIAYRDQQMPPGSNPSHARVGFDVDLATGAALLSVDFGVAYSGTSEQIRQWITTGQRRFGDFDTMRRWICGELAAAYGALGRASRDGPETNSDLRPDELTDLDAVRQSVARVAQAFFVDEAKLLQQLSQAVRGQDEALRTLSRRVTRHLARRHPRRPASFYALGPSGTGKTKMAQELPVALKEVAPATAVYDFLRLDMSEYQERHRISQLLGAPQGYVGYGDGAQLVDALRANPRSIILLDEIDKAHPDVFRTLLNALDAGRISAATRATASRTIDCRRAIFIFTSNLDCQEVLGQLEKSNGFADRAHVDHVSRQQLRHAGLPSELIGRVGSFLIFRPLSHEARAEVAALAIARTAREFGLQVEYIEPAVIVAVLQVDHDGRFGARPGEYVIDDLLGDALASACLRGASRIRVLAGPPIRCEPVTGEPPTYISASK